MRFPIVIATNLSASKNPRRWKNYLNFRLWFLKWYFCRHQRLFDFITGDFFPVRFTAMDIVLSKRLNSSYNLAEGTEDVHFPSS